LGLTEVFVGVIVVAIIGNAAELYVNTGLGSVHFPMRFRCPPEISVFILRSA
jgi:predicted MPP superfamily phosphohydrolase